MIINGKEYDITPRANLSGAYLSGANLSGANLSGANLSGANLSGVKNLFFQIPQEDKLVVYKKLKDNIIAKLLVPAEAKRTATPIGRKCRAEYVKVLEFFASSNGVAEGPTVPLGNHYDQHTGRILYRVGETVYPDSYNPDIRVECTNGIHFFLSREEAEAY